MTPSITRRALFASLVTPPRHGAIAFHYDACFSEREADWYGGFEFLVAGGILAPDQSDRLRRRGCRLLAYEWSSALYPGDWVSAAKTWQQRMCPEWSLTPTPVTGGAAESGKPAVWYDFGNPDLIAARAAYLADLVSNSGYVGLFFDTLGFDHLPAAARDAFTRRHPALNYTRCQGEFLAALRRLLPAGKLIFTNQGFRHPQFLLPHADLDLSESYFTYVDGRETRFRPWHDPARPWESIRTPMVELVGAAQKQFPHVRFVHVNYAAAPSADAALYGFAAAKLFGHESYLIVPSLSQAEEHRVYASVLGRALTASFEEDAQAGAAWRRFEHGTVAILSGTAPFSIPGTGFTLSERGRGYVFRIGSPTLVR